MIWSSEAQAILLARSGIVARWCLWVRPWDLTTGTQIGFGLWTGADHVTMTVEAESRLYYGAQGAVSFDPVVYVPGTEVRTLSVRFPSLAPEAETLLRGYRVSQAPAEVHLALLDPATHALVQAQRMWRGWVNRAPIVLPQEGGQSGTLEIASAMRALTQTLALKKTDQSQQLRAGDRFRRYGAVAAQVETVWN